MSTTLRGGPEPEFEKVTVFSTFESPFSNLEFGERLNTRPSVVCTSLCLGFAWLLHFADSAFLSQRAVKLHAAARKVTL